MLVHLEDRFDFDCHTQRQRGHTDRGAGVASGLAEHFDQQVGRAIDYLRLVGEIWCAGNEPRNLYATHDTVEVAKATLQADGKTVFLKMPGIKPVMQMRIKFNIDAADGEQVKSEIHSSIHKLPGR